MEPENPLLEVFCQRVDRSRTILDVGSHRILAFHARGLKVLGVTPTLDLPETDLPDIGAVWAESPISLNALHKIHDLLPEGGLLCIGGADLELEGFRNIRVRGGVIAVKDSTYEPPRSYLFPPFLIRLISLLIIGALLFGLIGGVIGFDRIRAWFERDEVSAVIDEFMIAMESRDLNHAYGLLSTDSPISIWELQTLLNGSGYVLFSDYERAEIESLNFSSQVTRQGLREGVARVSGKVHYRGGIQGTFEAILVKQAGEWRIYQFNVTIPREKFRPGENI